jgi:Domain of unknown function (DUF1835)
MLHLHNGDSSAITLREAGFPGTHFAFREALASGPTPRTGKQDEWFALRAQHLCGMAEKDAATVEQELRAQHDKLMNLSPHDEIILWFEHDLFCQVHLIYLLDHFAQHPVTPARLSLICINQFSGITDFRGLGQLTAEQMASLFDTRHEVSPAELQLAQRAWAAYQSDDPRELISLLNEDTVALPFLNAALWLHAARFPSAHNGLGFAENRLLAFIAEGVTEYLQLCPKFFAAEPAYGLGDVAVQQDLRRMAEAKHPLIELTGLPDWRSVQCRLTDTGREVLAGQTDFVRLNGLDQWLGGTHLTPDNAWRWHDASLTLMKDESVKPL